MKQTQQSEPRFTSTPQRGPWHRFRRGRQIAGSLGIVVLAVFNSANDCDQDLPPLQLDASQEQRDDIENAQLTFVPPGPLALGEGQEAEIIVEARNRRTGALRPSLESLLRLEVAGPDVVTITSLGLPGTGRRKYRLESRVRGTATLQASIDPTVWQLPKSATLASTVVEVVGSVTQLIVNPTGPLTVAPNAEIPIEVRAVDANGRLVPAAENFIAIESYDPESFLTVQTVTTGAPDGIVNFVFRATQPASGTITFSFRSGGAVQVRRVQISAGPPPTQIRVVTNPIDLPSDPAKELVALALGSTRQYQVQDGSGALLRTFNFAWVSASPAIASVDPKTGLAACLSVGRTRVGVELPNSQLSRFVDLECTRVQAVTITPSTPTGGAATDLPQGDQLQATAVVTYFTGLAVTPAATVAWRSDNPQIAEVNAQGRITALRPGLATITASAEGVAAATPLNLRVVAPTPRAQSITFSANGPDGPRTVGQQLLYTAVVYDQLRQPFAGATVTWRIANPAVARVLTSTVDRTVHYVAVEALAIGTTTIVAESPGVTESSPPLAITVVPTPTSAVARIVIEPQNAVITAPARQELRAVLYNAAGQVIPTEPGGTISFASSATAVSTIETFTNNGVTSFFARGRGAGTTSLNASYSLNGVLVRSDASPLLVNAEGTAGNFGSALISTNGGNTRSVRVGVPLLFQIFVFDVNGTPVVSAGGTPTVVALDPGLLTINRSTVSGGYFFNMTALAGAPVGSTVRVRYSVQGAAGEITMTIVP